MKKRVTTISREVSSVILIVISLIVLSSASAQLAPTWKPRQKEPLQKFDMPSMYIYRLETSPRMLSQEGPFISYQVNVDASGQRKYQAAKPRLLPSR
jgi:hypothetical protein